VRCGPLPRAAGGGSVSHLASLVLGDLVLSVLVALSALAVGPAGFGNVDLFAREIRELVSVRR
jgi:hypothetical protein